VGNLQVEVVNMKQVHENECATDEDRGEDKEVRVYVHADLTDDRDRCLSLVKPCMHTHETDGQIREATHSVTMT
jgi:hypothetical protein